MASSDQTTEEFPFDRLQISELDESKDYLAINYNLQGDNIWPKILDIMYSTEGTATVEITADDNEEPTQVDILLDQLDGISEPDMREAINLLSRAELVEKKQDSAGALKVEYLTLTKDGFEVAHERELSKNQEETNKNLAFFTLILGLAAILQTIAAALQIDQISMRILLLLLTLIVTVGLAIYQSDPVRWFNQLVKN